jgi:hypothetical protein
VTGATDLRSGAFGCPAISVVLGADADGEGYSMTSGNTYDYGYGSVVLGQVSRNQVHRSPAYVALNNVLSYTTDFTKIKIGNTDYNAITKANLDILSDKGYIFPRKFNNVVGTFTSSAHVATTSTDDVNSIQTKRTLSKAIRFVYQSLVQQLNSTVDIDPTTGKINILSVQNLELIAGEGLESMQKAGEVSGYKVFIDPDQNILSTGLLNVNISIVPTGTIEQITVNIGFVATI